MLTLVLNGLLIVLLAGLSVAAAPTWPQSASDELEDLMFLNTGYRARGFAKPVTPCSSSPQGSSGRTTAAEWIRTTFHDMATGNVVQGIGGLDASIVYELRSSDNPGAAFNTTLYTLEPFYGPQTSMSDLLALSTYAAVRSCGGPIIPVRTGRIDATRSGGSGVPQPQNAIGTFINQFSRMGFTQSQMITLVACGHTLGGVHASNQPLIVAPGSAPPDDFVGMDSTNTIFDNKIATEYVSGNTSNPLVFGLSERNRRNSDKIVFQSDGNATINTLTDPSLFQSQCQALMQQMIDVVPETVVLTSNELVPYDVKPHGLQLYLRSDGRNLVFSGEVRIRVTNESPITAVALIYKDRAGGSKCNGNKCSIDAEFAGNAQGIDESFTFYRFLADISLDTSISSFTVLVIFADGSMKTFDNNGNDFPVQDVLLFQRPQSCGASKSELTITAAVRSGTSGIPNLNLITKAYPAGIIRPTLNTTIMPLIANALKPAEFSYTLFSKTIHLNASQVTSGARFNLALSSDPTIAISLHDLLDVSTECAPPPSVASPESRYSARGCVSDSPGQRTLSTAGYAHNDAMTTESCANHCKLFKYFGTEYSRECFCANTVNPVSSNATDPDQSCNMACTGDASSKCGGSGFMNLYENSITNLPVSPDTVGSFHFQGCYTDSQTARTLVGPRHDDQSMTIEKCAAYCAQDSFAVMGVEFGGECYCSTEIAATSQSVSIWDCSMQCLGNGTEACGAADRLTLYAIRSNDTDSKVQSRRDARHRRHLFGHISHHSIAH